MCGIAGIMYKRPQGASTNQVSTGQALIDMLDGCQHRGPDSTGFALYEQAEPGQLHLRFFVGEGDGVAAAVEGIKKTLADHDARIVEDAIVGNNYRLTAAFDGDVQKLSYDLEHSAKVISIGQSLEIVKDIGGAHDVDGVYDVHHFRGTHGLGHVRLATESDVKPEASHPFWATGFSDVAIVHNGQITNYWKMRRRLERRGFEFVTDNDSELIAVYLADQAGSGGSADEPDRADDSVTALGEAVFAQLVGREGQFTPRHGHARRSLITGVIQRHGRSNDPALVDTLRPLPAAVMA